MKVLWLFLLLPSLLVADKVELGVDRLFTKKYVHLVEKKRVGLITNQTGVNRELRLTADILKEKCQLVALFSPEHGLTGTARAFEKISGDQGKRIYSLHGNTKRPTPEMLKGIDVLVYDIQEIGCRSYTYASTLFYAMEEAAKQKIPLVVLDRPNPMGGSVVDGPMLKNKWRSFLGYINIPYCHGMTIGELALFFNREYKIGCPLHVVPMKGWKRSMTFADTGLSWIPTSPYIPEADTPFFYASTGILGALSLTSIGIGYTLPFKVVGAPWINGDKFAAQLNDQKLPGVQFLPFAYRPFYGKFKNENCEGVKIVITNPQVFRPVSAQYMMIGILKSLYPAEFAERVKAVTPIQQEQFCKVNGTEEIFDILSQEKYIAWKLIGVDEKERSCFLKKREQYLLYK